MTKTDELNKFLDNLDKIQNENLDMIDKINNYIRENILDDYKHYSKYNRDAAQACLISKQILRHIMNSIERYYMTGGRAADYAAFIYLMHEFQENLKIKKYVFNSLCIPNDIINLLDVLYDNIQDVKDYKNSKTDRIILPVELDDKTILPVKLDD